MVLVLFFADSFCCCCFGLVFLPFHCSPSFLTIPPPPDGRMGKLHSTHRSTESMQTGTNGRGKTRRSQLRHTQEPKEEEERKSKTKWKFKLSNLISSSSSGAPFVLFPIRLIISQENMVPFFILLFFSNGGGRGVLSSSSPFTTTTTYSGPISTEGSGVFGFFWVRFEEPTNHHQEYIGSTLWTAQTEHQESKGEEVEKS